MKIINRNDATHTGHTRDAALRRLRQANRWLIAGSAILTGLLTEAAASAFPGHTIHKGATTTRRHVSRHKALQPPAQAPKASTSTTTTPSETTTSTETQAPSESSAPAQTPAESTPTTESAPEQSAPVEETHEAAPPVEEEHSEPVVSGGS
jgi:hypothetical protein